MLHAHDFREACEFTGQHRGITRAGWRRWTTLQAFLEEPRELEDQLDVEQMPVSAVAAAVGFAEPIRRRA